MIQPPKTTLVPCPQCHGRDVALLGEDSDRAETPEGLSGVTLAQCQAVTCLHEFTIVTHGQILRSIASWTTAAAFLS